FVLERPFAQPLVGTPLDGPMTESPSRIPVEIACQNPDRRQMQIVDDDETAPAEARAGVVPIQHRDRKRMAAIDQHEIERAAELRQDLLALSQNQVKAIGGDASLIAIGV